MPPDLASRRALRRLVLLVPAAYTGAREGSRSGGFSCSAGQTAGANPILWLLMFFCRWTSGISSGRLAFSGGEGLCRTG